MVLLNSFSKRRLIGLSVSLLALTPAPASFARVAANEVTFQDARGEDPSGPDITKVVVGSRVDGMLTFRINIPTHARLGEDMRIRVWVDSDYDRATGLTADELAGFDYFLRSDRDGTKLYRCGGSSCTNAVPQRTLAFSYRGGATFAISAYELATKRFRFRIDTTTGIAFDPATRAYDFTKAKLDFAPGQSQFWSYNVRLRPSRLLIKSFSTRPAQPLAGGRLSVRLAAIRNDTGTLLSSGRVACDARIGDKRLRPSSQKFVGKQATCVFTLPASARGQTLRGSITIAFQGRQVRKSFSRRIG
jgi:hypothetical protein